MGNRQIFFGQSSFGLGHDIDPLHSPFMDFNYTHILLAAIVPFLIFS